MKRNIFLLLSKPFLDSIVKYLVENNIQVFIITNENNSSIKKLQVFHYNEASFSKNRFPCKISNNDIILNINYKKDFFHKDKPLCNIYHAHPSLLPLYRGYFAISSQLLAGVLYSGLTIYKENGKIDAGNIIYQKKLKIEPYFFASDFIEIISKEIIIFLNKLINNDIELTDIIQNERYASYNQHNRSKNLIIDFNMPAISVYNMVRAYAPPFSCAYLNVGEKKCKILSCDIECWNGIEAEPGQIVHSNINGTVIACGDGSINIKKIEYNNKILHGEYLEKIFLESNNT